MLFRNLTLFRFSPTLRASLETLAEHLPDRALKPLGPLELSTRGFVSPFGRGHESLSHRVGDCLLLALGGEDKILPSAVLNEEVNAKLDAIRTNEGRNPGGRERKRIRDEVLMDLLPRAFARPSRTLAYLDLASNWLVVDSANRRNAEAVVSAIREALGSFPALPVDAEDSPRAILTSWIGFDAVPEGFALGDEFELIEPTEGGAIGKFCRQESNSEEIIGHITAGKQCSRLALVFEGRLSFVFGQDLVVRKLKFLESAVADLRDSACESVDEEVSATFALMSGELRRLLERLVDAFSLSDVEG